jgi:glycosyltransferase involved in cell wall biosynthesis
MDPNQHQDTKPVHYPEPSADLMPQAVSMVVSNYNHSEMLRRLVWLLSQTQKLIPREFELLITDSGSNDENVELVERMLAIFGSQLNIRYVYIDCSDERQADPKFNGYARCVNAGVKLAKHNIIVYADSSILIPDDYLWDLAYPHGTPNARRFVRSPLLNATKEQAKLFNCRWEKWQDFSPFTPSHGRPSWSIKKQHFMEVGGMDEDMCRYGAVDDDFVLRTIMNSCENLISRSPVLHIYHEEKHRHCDPRNMKIFEDHAGREIKVVNTNREWGRYSAIIT